VRNKFTTPIFAALALAVSGCVVQPVDGRNNGPQTQQPAYQPAPNPPLKRLIVEGPWLMFERGKFVRRIDVALVRGGIQITGPRRTFFAPRVKAGVFQGDQGGIYQFVSDTEARFANPNNGRRMRMRRP